MVEEKREDLLSSQKDNHMDAEIFKNIEANIPDDAILTTETEAIKALSFKNTSKKLCDIEIPKKIILTSYNSSLKDSAILTEVSNVRY